MLAAGTAIAGRSGALATKSLATSGIQRNLVTTGFTCPVARGRDILDVINNVAFPAQWAEGVSLGRFDFGMPFNPSVTPADYFVRALCSVSGDTDAGNYHTLTMFPDTNSGDLPDIYGVCKYSGFSFSMGFSLQGAASLMSLRFNGMSLDPFSGSISALTTPSAGALSLGGVKGAPQASYTGATSVINISGQVNTGLTISPGYATGTNSAYPILAKGCYQTYQSGQVNITQLRTAATVLGANGSPSAFVLNVGSTGAGCAFSFILLPNVLGKPVTTNTNLMVSSYWLLSSDGISLPFTVSDL